jgi:uncharacterized protein YjiS (DUF1127 family)
MFAHLHRKAMIGLAAALTLTVSTAGPSAAVIGYTDFASFQAATSGLTTDSFDAAPWTPVASTKPQGFTNLGVTWSAANAIFSGSINHSPSIAITSLDGTLGGTDIFDWIDAVLPAHVTAVGGWLTNFNQIHTSQMLAYDALDNLLGSVPLGNTGHDFAFLGLTSDTAIARVRFAAVGVTNPVADDIALDDFTFGSGATSIPVPEPSTIALFGAGALAALLRRRRRGADRTTLAAIDRRTLADIGIGRGEAVSAAHELGLEPLRRVRHV